MKKNLSNLILILAVLVSLTGGMAAPARAQDGAVEYYLSGIDCSAFPDISLLIRAVDANGNAIASDALADGFSLFENGQPVENSQFLGVEDGPKYIVFSLDLGRNSNLNQELTNIQNAMRDFASAYFVDGVDTVQIVAHRSTTAIPDVILAPTQSLDAFTGAIEILDLPASSQDLNGWQGLRNVYNDLAAIKPARSNTVIIHISRFIEGINQTAAINEANSLGATMAAGNVRVYVFQTDRSGIGDRTLPYRELTAQNNGEYVLFSNNADRLRMLPTIYTAIDENSRVFRVRFRSATAEPKHTIAVASRGNTLSAATDSTECSVLVQPPAVEISSPAQNTFLPLDAGQTTISVEANLMSFPDNLERKIVQAELFVRDEFVQSIQPQSNDLPFYFTLDVSEITGTQDLILNVRVVDELGLQGFSAPTRITIQAATIAEVVVPTAVPPTPIPECVDNPWSPACVVNQVTTFTTTNLIWIIVFAVMLVLLIMLISTRRQLAALSSPAREAISKGYNKVVDQVRKTMLGGTAVQQQSIAHLHVLVARPDRTGGVIDLSNFRTTLGRDPKLTDVQLFNLDDQTSVSSLHATIFFDQGKFWITDDNSTNGTYVNGRKLTPNDPFELKDNAEIILGDVFRQGAKLRFEADKDFMRQQGAPPAEIGEDFSVDLEAGEEYAAPPTQEPDYRKTSTFSGETEMEGKTEIFSEDPYKPARGKPADQPGKKPKDDDSWLKDL